MAKLYTLVLFLKILSMFVLTRKFGNVIHDIAQKYNGQLSVADLRKIEKLQKKARKVELDLTFLRNCLSFNVVPKFLCFRIPHCDQFEIKSIRKRLLKNAIRKREKEKQQLHKELKHHEDNVFKILSGIDGFIIIKAVKKNVDKLVKSTIKTHEKKLKSLTLNKSLPFTATEVIKNLSNYQLNNDEVEILKNGLSYSLPPFKVQKPDVCVSFEMISRFMLQNLKDEKLDIEVKAQLSHLANCYTHNYRPSRNVLKKHGILKRLKNNNDIVILKPDKGNGVVILKLLMMGSML